MTISSGPKTAFVLGGTGNMGREIVEHLALAGTTVVFSGRSQARGEALALRTGATFVPGDVTDRASADACLQQALGLLNRIDLFVTAIGMVFVSPIGQTSEAIIREVIEVNLTSVFRCSRWMFDHFKRNGGGVMVHVVSDAALRSIHHIPMYTTAKAGLLVMSELMSAEGASHSIRVNAICPGATVPGVQATVAGFEHHAEDASTWGAAPSGRHGHPTDVAKSVLWLASEDAAHVSGAVLRVDGAASAAMRGGTRA
ncbi:MAG: hypothetical protein BGO03_03500 [Mesorhizobium sp. 61-13]|nr:MAG: hypothetical protein BGO03_03500 [Mesorhizobium sp. 61-13]